MAGFLKKLFGGSSHKNKSGNFFGFLEDKVDVFIKKAGLSLSFDLKVSPEEDEVLLDFFGEDEELLREQEGRLLDAIQLFFRRFLQNAYPDKKILVTTDNRGFRSETEQALLELADKLKQLVLKKKKPVYFRALPPRERKLVHQFLSEDKRIKSRSVGEGLYKKVKIFLVDSPKKPQAKNNSEPPIQSS